MTHFPLMPGRWVAYEMWPGYSGDRWFAPVFVREIKSLKTGKSLLRVI
jgi:hypothetical protein